MNLYKIDLNPNVLSRTLTPFVYTYADDRKDVGAKTAISGLLYIMSTLKRLPERMEKIFKEGGFNYNNHGCTFMYYSGDTIYCDEGTVEISTLIQSTLLSERQFYEVLLQIVEKALEAWADPQFKKEAGLTDEWEVAIRNTIPVLNEKIADAHYPEVKQMPLKKNLYVISFKEGDNVNEEQPFVITHIFENRIEEDSAIQIFRDIFIKDVLVFVENVLQGTNYSSGNNGFIYGPYITDDIVWVDEGIVEMYNENETIGFSYRQFYLLTMHLAEKALEAMNHFDLKAKGIVDDNWETSIQHSILLLKKKFDFHNRTV
ncbi:hypothetical protein [Chitinophaga sp. S165]|uniref:hypothetical protein n=1 Tax=Chitinophaga sp. S165 TaxID=2135462 RepID=UPI000D71A91B|nr:hypothetical protein [Chitinophaga sp. S165]PWV48781.1 hypothetical protein C7475_10622 [Chitinophaga sp. S165]